MHTVCAGGTHPVLGGRHPLRILPEHGPGPIARNAAQHGVIDHAEVDVLLAEPLLMTERAESPGGSRNYL